MPPSKKHKRADLPASQRSTRPKLGSQGQQSEARRAIAAAYDADPGALLDPIDDYAGPGRPQATGDEQTAEETVIAADAPARPLQDSGVTCRWSSAAELSAETAAAVRAMLRQNMQPHYGSADWPAEWRRKQRNVLHRDSRCLLAWRDGEERALAGFAQYRFEEEDARPVLYLYEVQVAEEERGRGVGRQLLTTMQRLAQATHMAALMLTVQLSNGAAREFYRQCGFTEDETSPGLCDPAGAAAGKYSYQILSKAVDAEL